MAIAQDVDPWTIVIADMVGDHSQYKWRDRPPTRPAMTVYRRSVGRAVGIKLRRCLARPGTCPVIGPVLDVSRHAYDENLQPSRSPRLDHRRRLHLRAAHGRPRFHHGQ